MESVAQQESGALCEHPLAEPRTLSLTVAYNGAPFSGFARQPGQLTVQGSLEEALSVLFGRAITTTCAGRTDAGVHARAQVVSFDVDACELVGRSPDRMRRSLNALTHEDISVRSVEERPAGFSARFDALTREYRYFIYPYPYAPLFMEGFSWQLPHDFDLEAMRRAAHFLEGEHDFKSFCLSASAEGKRTQRFVEKITIERARVLGEELICITVVGNAFLHSMVRAIVGTLVAVGRGLRDPQWVHEVLAAKDRAAAGENAPACGLVLWDVRYPSA